MSKNNWLNNPKLRGFCCVLNAYGMDFNPELFLSDTTFDPELIAFVGKLDFPQDFKKKSAKVEPEGAKLFDTTFLSLVLSKSEESATQVKEATLFFQRYQDEVLRLSKFPNIEHLSLVFRVMRDEQENLPIEFQELAVNSGITMIGW